MTQPSTSTPVPCRQLVDGVFQNAAPAVVIERELRIVLNGEKLATASLMPGMEREFVTGYLYGQGFIKAADDIVALDITDDTVTVTLRDSSVRPADASYRIVSGGGRTAFGGEETPHITSDLNVHKTAVFRAMTRLFDIATVYRQTEGVHAAGIFTAEAAPVCVAEDIGRHNCLDKVIGYALLNDIDCRRHILVATGRMASEMVQKICRAGFPVAATKAAVTDKGREAAAACGMTLIGFVRDRGTQINTDMDVRVVREATMKIYTGTARVACH